LLKRIFNRDYFCPKQFEYHGVNHLKNAAMKNEHFAYLMARLAMGLSFFGHGLIRLVKLATFSKGMVDEFSRSMLPAGLVSAFSHALPFLEFIAGLLLLLGLFTRFALVLAWAEILALIFGCSLLEQWNAIFTQLFYGAYLAVLYYFTNYNAISIDARRHRLVS
jgi:thiosulfate dehydrogenase [quinone] large subunit